MGRWGDGEMGGWRDGKGNGRNQKGTRKGRERNEKETRRERECNQKGKRTESEKKCFWCYSTEAQIDTYYATPEGDANGEKTPITSPPDRAPLPSTSVEGEMTTSAFFSLFLFNQSLSVSKIALRGLKSAQGPVRQQRNSPCSPPPRDC